MVRWARRRQEASGQQFHTVYASLGLLIGLPLLAYFVMGMPLSWELPALKGFNFKGGMVIIPELAALLIALSIYTGAFIAEAVRCGILAVSMVRQKPPTHWACAPVSPCAWSLFPRR